jgi:hypothetical protein
LFEDIVQCLYGRTRRLPIFKKKCIEALRFVLNRIYQYIVNIDALFYYIIVPNVLLKPLEEHYRRPRLLLAVLLEQLLAAVPASVFRRYLLYEGKTLIYLAALY